MFSGRYLAQVILLLPLPEPQSVGCWHKGKVSDPWRPGSRNKFGSRVVSDLAKRSGFV